MDLANLLASRRWTRRAHPFPHFIAQEVFVPPVYREMEAAFQSYLGRGFGGSEDRERFSRSITGYDVYALSLTRALSPFSVFLSRPFHDMIAALTGVAATLDVNGALHHHAPGSLSGRPHNDLNPGFFTQTAAAGEVNLSDPRLCSYHRGALADVPVTETVRAAALLFYLNNPPWAPGDGGETGLYDSSLCRTESPSAMVPPLNNSLLLFECTPRSYHAFIRNRRHPRNGVIMWIHRPKADVIARFGAAAIVGWGGPAVLNEAGA